MKIGNFEIMKAMSVPGGKIWLSPLDNIINIRKVRAGTQITIGVGIDCIGGLANGEYIGGLYLCDAAEYAATKLRLEQEQGPQPEAATAQGNA